MSIVDHESTFQVDFPLAVVFDAATKKLKNTKTFSLDNVDKILHTIAVKAGVSLFSWGENITITFRELAPSRTEIIIMSTPKTGIMFGGALDMGKNRKNINDIMQAISAALQNLPPQAALPQRPQPIPQTVQSQSFLFVCPFCGQHLDCPPELENTACQCPSCSKEIVPTR